MKGSEGQQTMSEHFSQMKIGQLDEHNCVSGNLV